MDKIDNAFNPGDPVLDVAGATPGNEDYSTESWVVRDEQGKVDDIISGRAKGHYYLLIGEKGTGKTSMLLSAIRKVNGSRIAMMEAHADPEIFRIRLGKALDYEYHEEYARSPTAAILLSNALVLVVTSVASSVSGDRGTPLPCWTLNAPSISLRK